MHIKIALTKVFLALALAFTLEPALAFGMSGIFSGIHSPQLYVVIALKSSLTVKAISMDRFKKASYIRG